MSEDTQTAPQEPVETPQGEPQEAQASASSETQSVHPAVDRITQQRDELKTEVERLTEEVDKLRGQTQTTATASAPAQATTPSPESSGVSRDEFARLTLKTEGFSPDEVEEVVTYARGKGVTIEEAAKSDFVQAAISKMRAEKRLQDATPAPSQNTATLAVEGKPVEQMTRDEHRANLVRLREEAVSKGTGRGQRSRA